MVRDTVVPLYWITDGRDSPPRDAEEERPHPAETLRR